MNITTLGIDIAKSVFHLHGTNKQGKLELKKRLRREQLLTFMKNIPPCLVAMEACGGAHYWARKFQSYGHTVKLIAPQYVKPYVKTNKNDYNDAEAINEAVGRPTMRFVAIKSADQQAAGMAFKTRDLFVRQKTQLINALRGHLAEHGVVAPQGVVNLKRLKTALFDDTNGLPTAVVYMLNSSWIRYQFCNHESKLSRKTFWRCREKMHWP